MEGLHDSGRIQISVSEREVKYKDGELVTVYKIVEGTKTPTATLTFSDIETMKGYLTQEQIETLAVSNHLVRCQNIARNWDKEASGKGKIGQALKAKNLTDEQLDKVLAYIEKQ